MNRVLDFLPPVRPAQYFVCRLRGVTAITRVWEPGESRLCRLCPAGRCGADHEAGVCLVMTERKVPDRLAPMFRFRG